MTSENGLHSEKEHFDRCHHLSDRGREKANNNYNNNDDNSKQQQQTRSEFAVDAGEVTLVVNAEASTAYLYIDWLMVDKLSTEK
jgi:hypothetical protein